MIRRHSRLALTTALLVSAGAGLLAQGTQTATIAGEVVDSKGAAVAGASITLTSPALQGERRVMSDAQGRFRAPLLPPGEYTISVSKSGLNTVKITQRVGLEQTFSPRFVMKDSSSATVEVIAGAVAADKTEVKSAQNYTKDQVDTLPVTRTNLLSIMYLSPGVVENASESRGGVSVRGSMGSGNLFMVDGQNVNDNLYNGQRIGIIFDTVEETQVLTGALPAEYGDVEGGVVNSVTKSGGDEFYASIRWDLANPAWNAVKPKADRAAFGNNLVDERSIQVGGPLWKGRVWFHAAYFDNHPRAAKGIGAGYYYDEGTGNYYDGTGHSYQALEDDYRREYKITAALTQDHTLSYSWHNYKNVATQNYGAGEPVALTNLYKTGEFWNVSLRSIWSPNLTSSVRYGEKKAELGSTHNQFGSNDTNWVLYNNDDGYSYNNTIFNPNDPQPDNRNNKTANVKLTWFFNAMGSHQIDFGYDWYQGVIIASGDQAPLTITGAGPVVGGKKLNQWWVDIYDMDPVAQTAGVYDSYWGEYVPDKLTTTTNAFYVNDKWILDSHWVFQLGVRFDQYEAKSVANGKVASASSPSPRLGVKWDVNGDSKYVAGLSYAKYNGRMLESTLNNASYVNNPRYYAFGWTGAARGTYAQIQNVANYDFTSPIDFSDPALNIKFDGKLKHQNVTEIQASFTHNFKYDWLGEGFAKLTYVNKDWDNLIDFRGGNDGTVNDAFGNTYYIKTYFNNPNAKREYQAIELEANVTRGSWNFGGYASWSSLKGNFVGEGAASPGRGQGLDFFRVQNGTTMYSNADMNPYGYLPGHVPFRMRWTATHSRINSYGKQSWGFLFRFDSGQHYSDARTIRRADLNPGLSSQYGSSGTQYLGRTRGAGVYNGQSYLDLSVQQDFELMKVGARAINGFLKFDITNVLNHQQIVTFDTTWNRATALGLSSPWVASASYGTPTSSTNYGDARTVRLSTGIKF